MGFEQFFFSGPSRSEPLFHANLFHSALVEKKEKERKIPHTPLKKEKEKREYNKQLQQTNYNNNYNRNNNKRNNRKNNNNYNNTYATFYNSSSAVIKVALKTTRVKQQFIVHPSLEPFVTSRRFSGEMVPALAQTLLSGVSHG